MSKVSMSLDVPASIDEVWRVIGGFNALPEWHPAVQKSELQEGGRVRSMQLAGGASIVERLESFSEGDHQYSYSIQRGPLPVANYKATIRVRREPGKQGCVVEWSSDFEPSGAGESDAVKAIQSVYQAGFDNLRKMFGA
ncbi:MAG TPA: SRPBCC family protein [Burkholderiales bacterium]|nr:SRPBCC family protein [Burkholderiales bacterium]